MAVSPRVSAGAAGSARPGRSRRFCGGGWGGASRSLAAFLKGRLEARVRASPRERGGWSRPAARPGSRRPARVWRLAGGLGRPPARAPRLPRPPSAPEVRTICTNFARVSRLASTFQNCGRVCLAARALGRPPARAPRLPEVTSLSSNFRRVPCVPWASCAGTAAPRPLTQNGPLRGGSRLLP